MAARKEAIIKARSLIERQPVYLDTETTGIGPNDNIVEIAVIDDDGYTLIDTLVKPVGTISTETIRIHGITDEMVRASPRWMEVWDQVEPVLSGRFVGIYNAEFDLRLIQQSHNLNWMQGATRGYGGFLHHEVICPIFWSLEPQKRKLSLAVFRGCWSPMWHSPAFYTPGKR